MIIENQIRDTKIELFTIGAVDPNTKHIWGFQNKNQREIFLQKHLQKTITGAKFYRLGMPLKINASDASGFSFENSWRFDYARITNRPGTAQEMVYYAFIVDRQYININLTELAVSIDWVQTFYFNSENAPFWNVSGYGVATTCLDYKPLRGMGSEYPVTSRRNLWRYKTNDDEMCFVVYSTIDISASFTPTTDYEFLDYVNPFQDTPYHESDFTDNIYMGAVPYLINTGSTQINLFALIALNKDLNAYGQLGSITGIYALPREFAPVTQTNYDAINAINRYSTMKTITVTVPAAASLFSNAGLSVTNDILQGFGYTYISVSNQQGEEQIFTYEDFTSNPVFKLTATFSTGYPVILCYPDNYKFGTVSQPELFTMKQTSPPQCSLSSDNYAIWQAQNRNSISASIAAGKLSVANAKEAQQKTGGIATLLDSFFDQASDSVGDLASQLGLNVPEGMSDALTTAGYQGMNSILKLGMLGSFGLEASYVYKQQVAVAEQALKGIEAQFKDQQYTPTTLQGSNAYGDLMRMKQFGFQITVIAPDVDALRDLDRINESSGHICKGLITCKKSRTVFDYYRMLEAKIVNNPAIRPPFVNVLLTELFSNGVYIWWIQSNGDIDISNFAHPYAVTNTPL